MLHVCNMLVKQRTLGMALPTKYVMDVLCCFATELEKERSSTAR